MKSLYVRITSEFLGTAFLVSAVLGSGIMGERLAAGNVAIALLANTIATGAALVALILTFGPISGAHFNPVVTLADAWQGGIPWAETSHYILAQIFGGITGAIVAHLMFGLPIVSLAHHARTGLAQWSSEFVATFGLLSDLGLLANALKCRSFCRRRLHHGGLLVHGLYLVCKSCCHNCTMSQ